MIEIRNGKVYDAGVERTDLMPRAAKLSPIEWITANKKAIMGILGSLSGAVALLGAQYPDLAVKYSVPIKILTVFAMALFGGAHASNPDAVTTTPASPTPGTTFLGPVSQGPA